MTPVPIIYFSDILCIWAYIAQPRVDSIVATYGDQVRLDHKFCSVFADTTRKIGVGWKERGGYEGYNAHIRETAAAFPEIAIDPDLWLQTRPASSTGIHLFVKACEQAENSGDAPAGAAIAAAAALRKAFFVEGRDIGAWRVQCEIGEHIGAEPRHIEKRIHDGRAYAALGGDYQDAEAFAIKGSPSFVLNEGRQTLYGNVGFRVLDANIQELLRAPQQGQASWC